MFESQLGHITCAENDHAIISTASLPSTHYRVTGERICIIIVLLLRGPSVSMKNVNRLIDLIAMALTVLSGT